MRAENWGGLVSMFGSALVVLGGDSPGVLAMAAFLLAELVFLRAGHRAAGYSAGALLFAIGDVALCFSDGTAGNMALRVSLAAIAATWLVGSFRYPAEMLASLWVTTRPQTARAIDGFARRVQLWVGVLIVLQRLPALAAAAFAGGVLLPNPVVFAAVLLWLLSDVLTGRLHQFRIRFVEARNVKAPRRP